MLLGILSDTHDRHERTARAIDLLRVAGAEALVHCGDFVSPAIVRLLAGSPSWIVFGNNDADDIRKLARAAADVGATSLGWGGNWELAGRRLAATHGHRPAEVKRLLAGSSDHGPPDYLFTGHSHRKLSEHLGPTHHINPGALHRAREFTVALLDLTTNELRFVNVPP
ncbi:MAG: YfcE family phosphodiesterase [Planctomycetia bacterium]|nr:YfcE family phosphodiesterase [Planctomycetia bacterium]